MQPSWAGRQRPGTISIRLPAHAPPIPTGAPLTDASLLDDAQTLRLVVDGLQGLEHRVEQSEIFVSAEQRGYLTPQEDDRVRRGLLAYRNYRLALYDIILRLQDYASIRPAELQLKAFLVAYAAAVTLYAKSLRLDQLTSKSRLVRAKLNEPEEKFGIDEGFFDEVMAGYASLRNYGLMTRAVWFWTTRRRAIRSLTRSEPEPWHWLEAMAIRERRLVQTGLRRVWINRLKLGVQALWRTVFQPVHRLQYGIRSGIGERFAGSWLHPQQHLALDDSTLRRLSEQLAPGDILLMRSEGKLTAALLPGFWAHAAIYLGRCSQFRHLQPGKFSGLDDPDNLGFVIEGVSPRVRIIDLKTCLDADHVLVLEPQLSEDEMSDALKEAISHLDKEYDFEFDFNLSNRLVCTGLVFRAFHGRKAIEFQLIKRMGNFTLTGDDVVSQAVELSGRRIQALKPKILVLRRKGQWLWFDNSNRILTMLRRIQRGWRPMS